MLTATIRQNWNLNLKSRIIISLESWLLYFYDSFLEYFSQIFTTKVAIVVFIVTDPWHCFRGGFVENQRAHISFQT